MNLQATIQIYGIGNENSGPKAPCPQCGPQGSKNAPGVPGVKGRQRGRQWKHVVKSLLRQEPRWHRMSTLKERLGIPGEAVGPLKKLGEGVVEWKGERGNKVARLRTEPLPGGVVQEGPIARVYTEIEQQMASLEIASRGRLGKGGINDPDKIEFVNGQKAVFKSYSREYEDARGNITDRRTGYQGFRERATWEIAKIVGMTDLVAEVTERDINGEKGAIINWKEGQKGIETDFSRRFDGERDAQRTAMFDWVTGNTDRHSGNWLVEGQKLHLIDHGLTFPTTSNDMYNEEVLDHVKQMFDKIPRDMVEVYVANKERMGQVLDSLGFGTNAVTLMFDRISKLSKAKNWERLR